MFTDVSVIVPLHPPIVVSSSVGRLTVKLRVLVWCAIFGCVIVSFLPVGCADYLLGPTNGALVPLGALGKYCEIALRHVSCCVAALCAAVRSSVLCVPQAVCASAIVVSPHACCILSHYIHCSHSDS